MGKKYLKFRLVQDDPRKNTKVYGVYSSDNYTLGIIRWHNPWRKYCFLPYSNTVHDASCLQEIIDFLDKINKEHKDARKLNK